MTLRVRQVPLKSLKRDPKNTREHDRRNLDAIKSSLQRFGQQRPLVVDQDDQVVAGNGTLDAAEALGWEKIDVVRTDLTGSERLAYAIADNRTAELAAWNETELAQALAALQCDGNIDELVTGFNPAEIERAVRKIQGVPDLAEDDVPDPPVDPITKPGDLWVLGEHRLLCGDSTDPKDVARVMDAEKAVLLATDPPYCVEYTGKDRPENSGKDWGHVYREIDIKDLGEFLEKALAAVLPHVEASAAIYVWHAHLQYPVIDQVFEKFQILRHQPIIWNKPSSTFTYSYYRWAHEPCIFGWRKGHKPPHYLENGMTSVWDVDWEGKQRIVGNDHPTQKPVRLFEIPMEQHTRKGEVVLEPFSGSGSQLVAAERLGRRCRALEISPAFVDVAVRRWENLTGETAKLVCKKGRRRNG